MMEKEAKIYVAGHRGLVGSAIMRTLQQKGYNHLIVRTHEDLDLTDQRAVIDFFDKESPDYVFLAAAYVGGIMANNLYRADFIYRNLQIQNNIIHQSYLHKVKKLMFLGSTCIYPRDAQQPMVEDCLLTSPLEYTNEPYAIAKIAGLKMCESYNIQYGTNYLAVMPTNLYGPNDNFDLQRGHVLPVLVRRIRLAKMWENDDWTAIRKDLDRYPIEGTDGTADRKEIERLFEKYGIVKKENDVCVIVWGTGAPLREFLWSEDMADACVFLMESVDFKDLCDAQAREIRNCHINIGTGKEITIKELAKLIKEISGFRGLLEYDESKPDGTIRKLTDVSKLHFLGWRHRVDLKEGIARMLQL